VVGGFVVIGIGIEILLLSLFGGRIVLVACFIFKFEGCIYIYGIQWLSKISGRAEDGGEWGGVEVKNYEMLRRELYQSLSSQIATPLGTRRYPSTPLG
jgi:hypothetical protein